MRVDERESTRANADVGIHWGELRTIRRMHEGHAIVYVCAAADAAEKRLEGAV
jgi:hypothetical protein